MMQTPDWQCKVDLVAVADDVSFLQQAIVEAKQEAHRQTILFEHFSATCICIFHDLQTGAGLNVMLGQASLTQALQAGHC